MQSATESSIDVIEERLRELEDLSRELEPDRTAREALREPVVRYGERFLESLPTAPTYVDNPELAAGLLELPLRDEGRSVDELLVAIGRHVDTAGLNPASGGHVAYIPGGGLYPAALADYLAAISNRYAGLFYPAPGAVRMENLLVRWMCDLVGYPSEARGDLTSGGSLANLTAIVTAREAMEIGARDVDDCVIYCTDQVHHCVAKALRIAGLGDAQRRTVPMDGVFRMDADALEGLLGDDRAAGLRPFMVVASAGTTDTGAIDPLERVTRVAHAAGAWVHVDAAYGGFFLMAEEVRDQLIGLADVDSIVLDPHKGLFLPYGSGAVLVRDGDAMKRAHTYRAPYLRDVPEDEDWFSPADHSAELSRHFRGLRMWLPLQIFGLAAFRAALSEKIWLARYFYERVQEIPGIELGPYPELSVVMFRFVPQSGEDPDEANRAFARAIHADGRVFLSSTEIDGTVWIRVAVLNFRTRKSTIDLTLEVLRGALATAGLA